MGLSPICRLGAGSSLSDEEEQDGERLRLTRRRRSERSFLRVADCVADPHPRAWEVSERQSKKWKTHAQASTHVPSRRFVLLPIGDVSRGKTAERFNVRANAKGYSSS